MDADAPADNDPMQDAPAATTPEAAMAPTEPVTEPVAPLDLVAVEAELADVEVALARLEAGTYWTCEVSGEPLPDDLMAAEPTRRRLRSV